MIKGLLNIISEKKLTLLDQCLGCLEIVQSTKRMKYVTERRPSVTLSIIMNSSPASTFMTDNKNESCKTFFL